MRPGVGPPGQAVSLSFRAESAFGLRFDAVSRGSGKRAKGGSKGVRGCSKVMLATHGELLLTLERVF